MTNFIGYISNDCRWGNETALFLNRHDAAVNAEKLFGLTWCEAMEFVAETDHTADYVGADSDTLADLAPSGLVIEVDGGFLAFSGQADYDIWQAQK